MCLEGCCRHHPGVPVFHDALKGWSCCSRRSTDFTEFLNIPGCTNGRHSNEKPPEPEKKPAAEVNCPEVFFFIFSKRPLCHFPTNCKKYKSVRNKVRNETRNLQRDEQRQVACQCKENPKVFWKYINSKRQRKVHEHIGDLKSEDEYGNVVLASTNSENAEVLGKFFESVFVKENDCFT